MMVYNISMQYERFNATTGHEAQSQIGSKALR